MAVRTKEELMETLKKRIGDGTDDETLSLWEDVSDTFADYETRAAGDGKDWKAMYEENDRAWREKYRDRFFGGEIPPDGMEDIASPDGREEDTKPPTRFEELFTEK